jgi:hypothetical protein
LHAEPDAQGTHDPPLHTPPLHGVPGDAFIWLAQTDAPELHSIVPLTQTLLLGLQVAPCEQGMQLPPLQTPPVHGVPVAAFIKLAHVETPVEQDEVPTMHVLPGAVHCSPDVHAVQLPVWQTWLSPQGVPSFAFAPVSVHVRVPLAQTALPLWQALSEGVHAAPLVQARQAP